MVKLAIRNVAVYAADEYMQALATETVSKQAKLIVDEIIKRG